ncbi:MAG: tetratricopeptide repeat protein [Promethearchaeota archaeon]
MKLIDQAENFADRGKGDKAINLYEQAAQIYLDIGSYIKLAEIYIRISKKISQFKNNLQAIYRLESIIRKTEELKLYEISANLLIQLGNISFKMNDWETAGESYKKASEYLLETDPEEYSNLSSFFLLKAGQALERSPIKKTQGKRLILKAIMKINKFDELYEMEEKRGNQLLEMKEYEAAANKFIDISNYFKEALGSLDSLLDSDESKDTMLNAKARFSHFIAEYLTVAALCLRASENREFNDRIKEISNEAIEIFQKAIKIQKEYLFEKKTDFDKEIIYRITFDTMLLEITQGMLGVNLINSIDFLLENGDEHNMLFKKMKDTPYFKITKRIQKAGLIEILEDLENTHLGHFENLKNTLIRYFKK